MTKAELTALAERCDDKAIDRIDYALTPPQGYSGMATAERRAALDWLQIASELRARAALAGDAS